MIPLGFWYTFMKWYPSLLERAGRLKLSWWSSIWLSCAAFGELVWPVVTWWLGLGLGFISECWSGIKWDPRSRVYVIILVISVIISCFIWRVVFSGFSFDFRSSLIYSHFSVFCSRTDLIICPRSQKDPHFVQLYLVNTSLFAYEKPFLLAHLKAEVFTHFDSLKIPSGHYHFKRVRW